MLHVYVTPLAVPRTQMEPFWSRLLKLLLRDE
jgi:hypothetical protein